MIITFWVYSDSIKYDFVNLDDYDYIHNTEEIQNGFNIKSILWAFNSVYFSNWHPITALSYIFDFTMFNTSAWWYHLENVLFHLINVILLFIFLQLCTGEKVKSFLVASIFAVHPVNIESVVWISQRKTVLAFFFCMITLIYYVQYAKTTRRYKYYIAIIAFLFSLMSKPSTVPLPLILLLIDYWPLKRFEAINNKIQIIILEKGPFFILSILSSALTIIAQEESINKAIPLATKLMNSFVFYLHYLYKVLYPYNLVVLYPYKTYSFILQISCMAVFLALTMISIFYRKKYPYLFLGWLWFVISLIPVIQIVAVGEASIADRYLYLPIIGLLIFVIWFIHSMSKKVNIKFSSHILIMLYIFSFVWYISISIKQVKVWENSMTLYEHNINIVDNALARNNLAGYLISKKLLDEGVKHLKAGLKISPDHTFLNHNLNIAMSMQTKNKKVSKQQEKELINRFYLRARKMGISDADFYRMLGSSYNKAKSFNKAFNCYAISLLYDDKNIETLNEMNNFLSLHSEYKDDFKAFINNNKLIIGKEKPLKTK